MTRQANPKNKAMLEQLAKDQYVIQWLTGIADKTKGNYLMQFSKWCTWLDMTPTQQINQRIADLKSDNLAQRNNIETKFRQYKAELEKEEKFSAVTIKTMLICIASFYGRTVGKLNLKRGDWSSTLETRIKNKLVLDLTDIKGMYAHGSLRDRALLLVLAQSGFSEVDVSEFRLEDMHGFYEHPLSLHYFIEKPREKTGEIQATCISFEAMHDLRDLLRERNNPTSGYLFTSQTKDKGIEGIEVRRIHEAMKKLAEKSLSKEKAENFKTKMLRSFYNSKLLRADLKQEVKDLMLGHQRLGARGHYGYDAETIQEAYKRAFEFMSINGMQSREDIAKIKSDLNAIIGNQQVQIESQNGKLDRLERDINNLMAFMESIAKGKATAKSIINKDGKEDVQIDFKEL